VLKSLNFLYIKNECVEIIYYILYYINYILMISNRMYLNYYVIAS